ncbi:Crp/Fnr family transcriptional regulator [Hymenobacter guriensis]|uniref:Cyclic nucleotide-binding domain-containing protein n=1 Tax=Hymenobacter guriensis TaxID=2793065 RepID=A0ABS0L3X5_9BACT|nr:cyclic nucleotide-binding domain-containing protein [Hymenobacter guriensis]MBG8554129.1 cyclic nucleotide-binding domain-containing protein [Hymenobacter guriensis]
MAGSCTVAAVTHADYKPFLRKFHATDDSVYDLLFAELQPVSYQKGEFLVQEGSVERDLYFVYEGVQIAYFNNDGKEHVVSFSYPPSLAGIPDSFLNQNPSEYAIRALTASRLGRVSFQRLNELFDQSQQLERLFRKMVEAKFVGLAARHREFHACSIEERFIRFTQRSAPLFQLVPHKYIASYLHIDPTNFSKLYNSIRF